MINNIDEMLAYFNSLYNCVKENKYDIYLDMNEVINITPDAILYLLSVLDYYESRGLINHKIRGNIPNDRICAEILMESGFLKYVRMPNKPQYKSTNFLRIEKDRQVRADIADNVISFSEKKLNYYNKEITESIYNNRRMYE
jgi:hypothetical protein